MADVTVPSITLHNNDCTSISHFSTYENTTSIEILDPQDYRLCIVGTLVNDEEVTAAAQKFEVPIVTSENGLDYVEDVSYNTFFIVADFETPEFDALNQHKARILGKPALLEQSNNGVLRYSHRPVYCYIMTNCLIVFTGFRRRTEVSRLLKLVHYMGGSVKNEITEKVTHLLAHSSTGDKYQYAVTFGVPVMGEDWVNTAWAHRDEFTVRAQDDNFMKHKIQVFHNLRVVLIGFSSEDQQQMEDFLIKNSGTLVSIDDPSATHVVVDQLSTQERPVDCQTKAHIVKAEWFWASIQMDACANEKFYQLDDAQQNNISVASPKGVVFSPGTPGSRSRRRKRLRETVQLLAHDNSPSLLPSAPPASKRRSSVGDLAYLSTDSSLLDDSKTIQEYPSSPSAKESLPISPPAVDLRLLTPRYRVFHELVKTECNYVGILDTIQTVIKEPLENPSQPGGIMLDGQELRYIFGNLPPIHEVHIQLRDQLLKLAHDWREEDSIGQIILNHIPEMEKAYPPFVNYFENVKEMLQRISMERPRFHAFLRLAQNKSECNRQNFQELLVRPVQRLPSMTLLITELIKHTDKASPDHINLEKALNKIKDVLNYINDDKRRTEAKLKLFEIHNDIDNCPPNLIAAHRTYVSKADVRELSDTCSGRGDVLTLFLFNDVVEICKKKSKYNSIKSPSRTNLQASRTIKSYKHLELMPLAHIKRVVDIRETDDCHSVFAMIVRSNQEVKERLYTFTVTSDDNDDITKSRFLHSLCKQLANVVCRSDVENLLVSMDPQHLDIGTSDVSITSALSKAIRSVNLKFATKTGRKVSRAFSFNKSPSKLKRAVSTVMSPFGGSLPTMRGATSVNNLADLTLASTPPSSSDVGSRMTTPRPRRPPLKHM